MVETTEEGPAIRFLCLTCKAVMTAPVERAGQKINCLKCGQRLQIPCAEHAKTILAPSLGGHSDTQPSAMSGVSLFPIAGPATSASLATPATNPPQLPQGGAGNTLANVEAQWQKLGRSAKIGLIAGSALIVLFLLVCAGIGLITIGSGGGGIAGKYVLEKDPGIYLELKSDGTFYVVDEDFGKTGKYEVQGSQITFKFEGGIAVTGKIEGKTIVLEGERLIKESSNSGGGNSKTATGGEWGKPVKVSQADEGEGGTTFLVRFKDAWWTDYGSFPGTKGKFFVVYYYKNLGPREGQFHFGKAEIKTNKGHIFPGQELTEMAPPVRRMGWWPAMATKIEHMGQSALVFSIPTDEVPTELINTYYAGLAVKLPQTPFAFRLYSQTFGFLPQTSEAVPGLIQILKGEEQFKLDAMEMLGRIGPAAKDAVPALLHAFEHESDFFATKNTAAAKALGNIGPAAKEAIPALTKIVQYYQGKPEYSPANTSGYQVFPASKEALAKITAQK